MKNRLLLSEICFSVLYNLKNLSNTSDWSFLAGSVCSQSLFVKCAFCFWHWTIFSIHLRALFQRGVKPALSLIDVSFYFRQGESETTAWTGNSSDWNQWRMQPTFLLSFTVRDSSDWTSMTTSSPSPHPSFSPRSSSSWEWGDGAIRGRLDSVIRFTGQLIPHRTGWDCRNYGKERHRWDKHTATRLHGYLNIDYRLIDFYVQKSAILIGQKMTTLLCVFKIKLTDLTIN